MRDLKNIFELRSVTSCLPSPEVRNVCFRSNPLKELLFTRDKWIYLPERIHTRRWLYFIVHFSRSIVTTVVEKTIPPLVASPKTPTAIVTFVLPRTEKIYTYEMRLLNLPRQLIEDVQVHLSLPFFFFSFFLLYFNKPCSRQRLYFIVPPECGRVGTHRKRITPRIPRTEDSR